MATTIHNIPFLPANKTLAGKLVMVHDLGQPNNQETFKVPITDLIDHKTLTSATALESLIGNNSLVPGAWYKILNFEQGNLLGNLYLRAITNNKIDDNIFLEPSASNFSPPAIVNQFWRGKYNWDTQSVNYIEDELGNKVWGYDNISRFFWFDQSVANNIVIGTLDLGSVTNGFINNYISQGSILNLQYVDNTVENIKLIGSTLDCEKYAYLDQFQDTTFERCNITLKSTTTGAPSDFISNIHRSHLNGIVGNFKNLTIAESEIKGLSFFHTLGNNLLTQSLNLNINYCKVDNLTLNFGSASYGSTRRDLNFQYCEFNLLQINIESDVNKKTDLAFADAKFEQSEIQISGYDSSGILVISSCLFYRAKIIFNRTDTTSNNTHAFNFSDSKISGNLVLNCLNLNFNYSKSIEDSTDIQNIITRIICNKNINIIHSEISNYRDNNSGGNGLLITNEENDVSIISSSILGHVEIICSTAANSFLDITNLNATRGSIITISGVNTLNRVQIASYAGLSGNSTTPSVAKSISDVSITQGILDFGGFDQTQIFFAHNSSFSCTSSNSNKYKLFNTGNLV